MKQLFALLFIFIFINSLGQEKKTPARPDTYNYLRGMEELRNGNNEEALEFLNKEIEENPKNGYAYSWIAMIHGQQEEYGKAISAANLSIKNLPKKDSEYLYFAYETRAQIYVEIEDTIAAISDYTTAIKILPEKEDAYEKRAQIYYEQKKYDLADSDYKKLIELDRGGFMGYMGIGRNRNAQELWDDAIIQFDYVAKLHSDYSLVYAFRAESYIGKKNWDKATDDLLTALKIDGNDKAFYLMQDLEDVPFTKLKAKFQIQSAKEPNNEKWPYYLGIIHERNKQYIQAVHFYEEANKRDLSAITLERIANCYDSEGQYDMCLITLEKAINMKPDRRSLLSMKANALFELGKTKEAIDQWDSIIVKFPDYDFGYYSRGWLKVGINDVEGAIEDYSMAVTLDPEYAYAYECRAKMYEKQGNTELAKADHEKVVELEPTPDDYEVSMYAYQALGNIDKAIEVMDTLIARDSTNAGVYYDAACLYSIMHRTDVALTYLEKSLNMGYKSFAHIAIDYDMDNLRELPKFKKLIEFYREKSHQESIRSNDNEPLSSNEEIIEIPFTKDDNNNLCKVKCSINDLPLYFIFDTGASDVSLSQVEATFMMKNGYLNKQDVVGNSYFSDAVGNVNVGTIINLRKVDFGGMQLTNVKASVVNNQQAPLLLGQSVLGRLGKIEIDNSKHVLIITTK